MIQPTAFKTYDIRGIVETELPIAAIYRLSQTIAQYLRQHDSSITTIAIGRDGRVSSPAISQQLEQGLLDAGLRCIDLGIVPTPLVYYAQYTLPVQAGIIITASHNPAAYNGLKIVVQRKTLFGTAIQTLKEQYYTPIAPSTIPAGHRSKQDIIPQYIAALRHEFATLIGSQRPMIIDCGNGATGAVIPDLIQEMQWQHATLRATTIDGTFPDRDPNPTIESHTAALRAQASMQSTMAIAFDGDGDRVVFIDEQGRQLTGDTTLAIIAAAMAQRQQAITVVTDVKCSPTLQQWLQQQTVAVVQTPCGIGFIKEAMQQHNAPFGGELSCHYCFTDRHHGYDDGIYTALRLLELLQEQNCRLATLVDQLPTRYTGQDLRIPCPGEHRATIIAAITAEYATMPDVQITTIDGISVTVPTGSFNLRGSNTEAVLSVRIEGATEQQYQQLEQEILGFIAQQLRMCQV